jgi:4-hydroxybenzoate polyprenyltransferase
MNACVVPLCVNLDATLTPIDTLSESVLNFIRQSPVSIIKLALWRSQGKSHVRKEMAARARLDPAAVPLRRELVEWLETQHAIGRKLVLVTAADQRVAVDLAAHVKLFDEIIAGDGREELCGAVKRRVLVDRYGERGFDYVGADAADEEIWTAARHAIVVGDSRLADRVARRTEVERTIATPAATARTWIKAFRLHQWVKNGLIFLPLLLSHSLSLAALRTALLAFVAFGLCASSVYVLNDLLDLASDRTHPRKRHRPFAAGMISARSGLIAASLLLLAAAGIATAVNLAFIGVLAAYYLLTWSYSVRLKRVALLDVMVLAALYTIRIIAGAAANDVPLSFWLLAFSVFMFLSLGFVKRYAELDSIRRAAEHSGAGRGYRPDDLPLVLSLGSASGYSAIVVLALYINSPDSGALYHHHKPLWLVCPLMLYWISRVWTLTTRGRMHDDPVVFAIRDRPSLLILGLLALSVLVSI